MLTLRITLVAVFALAVAACGAALADSDDGGLDLPDPGPTETTTTAPNAVIEDPPLPMAPDFTPPDAVIEDPPLPMAPDFTPPDAVIEDPPLPMAPDFTPPDAVIEDPPLPMAPDTTEAPANTAEVSVFFVVEPDSGIDGTDFGCGLAAAVTRRVQSPQVLTGAFEAMLAGPTDEEHAAGYGTVLTDEVGWELASVTIVDGTALIDFSEDSQPFNNMTASCVHLALMAQLEATATQFSTVDRAVFSVGGDIATFYHWLEREVPEL